MVRGSDNNRLLKRMNISLHDFYTEVAKGDKENLANYIELIGCSDLKKTDGNVLQLEFKGPIIPNSQTNTSHKFQFREQNARDAFFDRLQAKILQARDNKTKFNINRCKLYNTTIEKWEDAICAITAYSNGENFLVFGGSTWEVMSIVTSPSLSPGDKIISLAGITEFTYKEDDKGNIYMVVKAFSSYLGNTRIKEYMFQIEDFTAQNNFFITLSERQSMQFLENIPEPLECYLLAIDESTSLFASAFGSKWKKVFIGFTSDNKNVIIAQSSSEFSTKKTTTPQIGETTFYVLDCNNIQAKVTTDDGQEIYTMEFNAPVTYSSSDTKLHTFKFKTEKNRDLFVKHIEAKKNALKLEILKKEVQEKQQKHEQEQQQQQEQQERRQEQQKKYDTIQIVVPVRNEYGSIVNTKVEIPVTECHQYGLTRAFSSNDDFCGVYDKYFVRGRSKSSLQDRFNELLKQNGDTNIDECNNHCFNIKNCSINIYVPPISSKQEQIFQTYGFGLTITDTTKKSGNPFLFLFKDRHERDRLLFKLTDIKTELTPNMPYDDRKKTTDLFLRCIILTHNVICAFTPYQIIWGSTLEKLYSRLEQSKSGLVNESGIFITFSDVSETKALSELNFQVILKNGDKTTFTFKDKKINEKFQVKLRRNLVLVENSQKSIAQKTASEEFESDLNPYESVKNPSLLDNVANFLGIRGGSISTKNKTKHSTKTKHKSNHKSKHKAKTQSKPKHKNKSKLNAKSKPKHRAKTIKKNKRAHHKFDKKYTRKR